MSRVICDQLRCRYNEGEYCEYSGDLIWLDGKCECQVDDPTKCPECGHSPIKEIPATWSHPRELLCTHCGWGAV